jgi:hypothetical protein
MILVRLLGGLGNQMFQYALGRHLAEIHQTPLKVDTRALLDRTPKLHYVFREYALDVFNIIGEVATHSDVAKFLALSPYRAIRWLGRIQRKLGYRVVHEKQHFCFDSTVLHSPRHTVLSGYWQNANYFADIAGIIRKEFTLRALPSPSQAEMACEIGESNSICVFARRAEYVNDPVINQFFGVCDANYFQRAADLLIQKIPSPRFFVFSDDLDWCKDHFNFQHPTTFVSHQYAGEKFGSYLYLMSCCKHFIISNSSYSWWGAWLSGNPNKIVIAPRKWLNRADIDTSDVTPPEWLRI